MNERARKLLDERFGEWKRSIIDSVVNAKHGRWQKHDDGLSMRGRASVWKSAIDDNRWGWRSSGMRVSEFVTTEDAAKLAADFALYCEIVDAEKPKQSFTVISTDDVDALEADGKVSSAGAAAIRSALHQSESWAPSKSVATAGTVLLNDGFEIRDFLEENNPNGTPWTKGAFHDLTVGDRNPWFQRVTIGGVEIKPSPEKTTLSNIIPASFRAKLADEWELRPDGRHVRKATWEGMEFVAIEIVRSQKDGKVATFRCPGQASRSTVIVPCGWSKKDRRYLSQLWALWSEHHQEVPGADWQEVAKARLGVK